METWAPIVGMTMVSIGSVIALVSLGALLYFNWPRSNRRRTADSAIPEAAEPGQAGERQL